MQKENEPQVGSNFLGKPMSRRSFLGNSAAAAAGLFGLATVGCESASKKPKIIDVVATPEKIYPIIGYKVFIDAEGLPYKYVEPAGSEVPFDLKSVRSAQERAQKLGEPELVGLISVPPSSDISTAISYSPDHPETPKLPDDVLTEAELEERGVKIIQADNTTLSIRKGAFEVGGPVAQFDGSRKLIIAVLDAPAVLYSAAKDSKYDKVRKLLHEKEIYVNNYRWLRISQIEEAMSDFRDAVNKKSPESQSTILGFKVMEYEYRNTKTDEEILLEANVDVAEAAGQYYAPNKSGIGNTAVIFIAAGKYTRSEGLIRIYFDASGSCVVDRTENSEFFGSDYSPQASQTYPDPLNFRLNKKASESNPESYPYGAQTAGQALHHELEHDELITEGDPPNFSEYRTDMNAMEEIRSAWYTWVESGHKDNSGYPFVFSLKDSGFILTKGIARPTGEKVAA